MCPLSPQQTEAHPALCCSISALLGLFVSVYVLFQGAAFSLSQYLGVAAVESLQYVFAFFGISDLVLDAELLSLPL